MPIKAPGSTCSPGIRIPLGVKVLGTEILPRWKRSSSDRGRHRAPPAPASVGRAGNRSGRGIPRRTGDEPPATLRRSSLTRRAAGPQLTIRPIRRAIARGQASRRLSAVTVNKRQRGPRGRLPTQIGQWLSRRRQGLAECGEPEPESSRLVSAQWPQSKARARHRPAAGRRSTLP
jgi:hypothetical protein